MVAVTSAIGALQFIDSFFPSDLYTSKTCSQCIPHSNMRSSSCSASLRRLFVVGIGVSCSMPVDSRKLKHSVLIFSCGAKTNVHSHQVQRQLDPRKRVCVGEKKTQPTFVRCPSLLHLFGVTFHLPSPELPWGLLVAVCPCVLVVVISNRTKTVRPSCTSWAKTETKNWRLSCSRTVSLLTSSSTTTARCE